MNPEVADDKDEQPRKERKAKSDKKKIKQPDGIPPNEPFPDFHLSERKDIPAAVSERPSAASSSSSTRGREEKIPVSYSNTTAPQPVTTSAGTISDKDALLAKAKLLMQSKQPNDQPQRRPGTGEGSERVQRETISLQRQLNSSQPSNATTSNNKPIPSSSPTKGSNKSKLQDEDNYDDDFEDYDLDFEDLDEDADKKKPATLTKPSSKSTAPPTSKKEQEELNNLKASMERENKEALMAKAKLLVAAGNQKQSESKESKKSKNESKRLQNISNLNLSSTNTGESIDKSSPKNFTARRNMKFSTINLSTAGDLSADPRAKRLAKLRDLKIFDLVEEKIVQLNILPGTNYDIYLRHLRAQPPTIKQSGTPFGEDRRDVEINTEDIITFDKEMQFSYGDDTSLLNVMKVVQNRKKNRSLSHPESVKGQQLSVLEEAGVIHTTSTGKGNILGMSSTRQSTTAVGVSSRLSTFLQRSSQLAITIIEENVMKKLEKELKRKGASNEFCLFSPEYDWVKLGTTADAGENAFLMTRNTSCVRFSTIQPHFVMTAHPYPTGVDTDDLKPSKGLCCLWDLSDPGQPSWLLACAGQVSCCCPSSSQTFIVVAGTAEGVVNVWDMRESASYHKDKDSIDMNIPKGIRKPCYSTAHLLVSLKDTDLSQIHCYGITQIESLTTGSGSTSGTSDVNSQFASIDYSGLVILWLTTQDISRVDDNLINTSNTSRSTSVSGGERFDLDMGLSPWSTVRLVRNRVLRLTNNIPSIFNIGNYSNFSSGNNNTLTSISNKKTINNTNNNTNTNFTNANNGSISNSCIGLPYLPYLSTIPNDSSLFLINSYDEKVYKLVRYGDAIQPKIYDRAMDRSLEVDDDEEEFKAELDGGDIMASGTSNNSIFNDKCFRSEVTAISASRTLSSIPIYFILIGRSDGIVDLFKSDEGTPIQSWNMGAYIEGYNENTYANGKLKVVMLKWISQRWSSFLVVTTSGFCYYFDLLKDTSKPILSESLKLDDSSKLTSSHIHLSETRAGSTSIYLSVAYDTDGIGEVKFRRLWAGLFQTDTHNTTAEDEDIWLQSMATWLGRNVSSNMILSAGGGRTSPSRK